MSNAFVVSDPKGELPLAELAPNLLEHGHVAVRVEPTPGSGADQIAEDVLTSLRRRPRLATRWPTNPTDSRTAAWLWCHAHGIAHVVIPRAQTVRQQPLRLLAASAGYDSHVSRKGITWWLIDSSEDGALTRAAPDLRLGRANRDRMLLDIRYAQLEPAGEVDGDYDVPGLGGALRDAHPTLFATRLNETLDAHLAGMATERFHAAAHVARERKAFSCDAAALWYLLAQARDPSDATLVLRGAQLGFLQRRVHLSMASTAWEASQDARTQISAQADHLLSYVDPLIAATGALAIQFGLAPDAMRALRIDHVRRGRLDIHAKFIGRQSDPVMGAFLRGQTFAALDARPNGSTRTPLLSPPRSKRSDRGVPGPISRDRINALLRIIELERNADISYAGWSARHDIRWDAV